MLQPALLLMVHIGPSHGYDLMERLKQDAGVEDIDPSLIYRALHGLEAEGLIQSVWDDKDSQGPPRRIYSITGDGEEILTHYVERLKTSRKQIDHLIEVYEKSAAPNKGN
ncbi:MAG: PadR family transcriptional regulator [Anaerolineae bacterium]|jgi:DNA-binding PadR family transcriptional regulator|nr:PadR family transcriptional regulator [Anaerolineae bacterium]